MFRLLQAAYAFQLLRDSAGDSGLGLYLTFCAANSDVQIGELDEGEERSLWVSSTDLMEAVRQRVRVLGCLLICEPTFFFENWEILLCSAKTPCIMYVCAKKRTEKTNRKNKPIQIQISSIMYVRRGWKSCASIWYFHDVLGTHTYIHMSLLVHPSVPVPTERKEERVRGRLRRTYLYY